MRLKTDIWVKAYLRRVASAGGMGVVVRHGYDEAGAIFIKVRRPDGSATLYAPAPAGLSDGDGERRFVAVPSADPRPEREVDDALEREARFDSDVWVVEIESADGSHHLDGWLLATGRSN